MDVLISVTALWRLNLFKLGEAMPSIIILPDAFFRRPLVKITDKYRRVKGSTFLRLGSRCTTVYKFVFGGF